MYRIRSYTSSASLWHGEACRQPGGQPSLAAAPSSHAAGLAHTQWRYVLNRYFTALDGKVRRKNKQNLTNVRIEEGFNK